MKPSGIMAAVLVLAVVILAVAVYYVYFRDEPEQLDSSTSFEVMVRGLTGRLNSMPLPAAILDSLKLEDRQFSFPDTVSFGRTLARARDWLAVEQMFFTLPPDSATEYNFRELRLMEEAGLINGQTPVAYDVKRALILGDSAQVAQCLESEHSGQLHLAWYYPPAWEPAELSNPIVKPDPNATCGYAPPPDSTEQATSVP